MSQRPWELQDSGSFASQCLMHGYWSQYGCMTKINMSGELVTSPVSRFPVAVWLDLLITQTCVTSANCTACSAGSRLVCGRLLFDYHPDVFELCHTSRPPSQSQGVINSPQMETREAQRANGSLVRSVRAPRHSRCRRALIIFSQGYHSNGRVTSAEDQTPQRTSNSRDWD